MTIRSHDPRDILQQEDLNFLLTNRIPRRLLTRFMGWFSQIEQPLVRDAVDRGSGGCSPISTSARRRRPSSRSMHDCFIRELKDGARPVDADPGDPGQPVRRHRRRLRARSTAPSCSRSRAFPTRCRTCWRDPELVERHRDGRYVTLRLTSSMYHRFHAPHDCRVEHVTYISGDTWNVNPIALQADREAVLQERARGAANAARRDRPARHAGAGRRHPGRQHPAAFPRRAAAICAIAGRTSSRAMRAFRKGEEMGWFEHGSTIIVFAPGQPVTSGHGAVRAGSAHRLMAQAQVAEPRCAGQRPRSGPAESCGGYRLRNE